MTKEQLDKGKELDLAKFSTELSLGGLQLVKEGTKAHLKLIVQGYAHYDLDNSALESVLDTLIKVHEEKLNQIKKEFNEL